VSRTGTRRYKGASFQFVTGYILNNVGDKRAAGHDINRRRGILGTHQYRYNDPHKHHYQHAYQNSSSHDLSFQRSVLLQLIATIKQKN
jgi:hypothetical protein